MSRPVSALLSLLAIVLCCRSIDAAAVPKGVILVKGATPGTSDSSTPLPEQGRVADGRYRNAYFGLTYPIPAGWSEQPAGPPPSDGGSYVLSQFAVYDDTHRLRASVLLAAQDLFFTPVAGGAKDLIASVHRRLEAPFAVESGPEQVTIGGRAFQRLAYAAPAAGLHWRVLATDARCHALTFTFSGIDVAELDRVERELSRASIATADAPLCLGGYAAGENVVEKREPLMPPHRYNRIPVRFTVGSDGRVKQVHLLSAFPDQSDAIIAALHEWRFKPYRRDGKAVAVETGMMFGVVR